jgi:hypothetical protein
MARSLLARLALAAFLALGACNKHEEDPWAPVPPGATLGTLSLGEVDRPEHYDRSQASSEMSVTFFGAFVVLAIGGMLSLSAFFWWSSRRRARLEENFDPNARLQDGVSVVFGRVETDDGGPAVILRVQQRAREWQYKGAWNHAWEEVHRELHVRPFIVRTANGTTVRVEPPNPVQVRGEFTSRVRHNHTERTEVLEIKHGAEIHVYGALSGSSQQSTTMAYRAGGTMPVLSAATAAPMVISTEKPGAQPRARAKMHRNMGIALAAWLLIAVTMVFQQFVVLAVTGDVVQAQVTATRQWREWVKPKNSRGYWRYHYELRAESDGNVFVDEVSNTIYMMAASGQLPRAPFMVSSVSPSVHQFGNDLHTGQGRLGVAILLALVFACVYPGVSLSTRPWYQKKKLKQQLAGHIEDGDAREAALKRSRG